MENNKFIKSDIHPLKQVIVHPPGKETNHTISGFGFIGRPGFSTNIISNKAKEQHNALVKILKSSGVEVLYLKDLINNALKNLKDEGILKEWLLSNFPTLQENVKEIESINADDLLGASDRSFYRIKRNVLQPTVSPLASIYYTRDLGVILPNGLILSSFGNKRTPETKIARLIFEYSEKLREIPIILDCEKEGIKLQGGDIIVLDENTIIVGLNNMTEVKSAETISKKLNKNVIGVHLPKRIKFINRGTSLSSIFLHLDTVFNLVDKNKALVVPYFFQKDFIDENPFKSVLKGVLPTLKRNPLKYFYLNGIINKIDDIGFVDLFEAGTGAKTSTGLKLVDYLEKELNFKIIFSGGPIPKTHKERIKHTVETVMPEITFQGTNVVAIRENEVIMYKENTEETQNCLEKEGVKVSTFDGSSLVTWNGGPHCMTLPINRF